jgi:hypothetical protein
MPRKPLDIAVIDLTQAIGLLVRRARSAAASHDLGGSMSHAWRALRHRNFKLFFFGQSIS